MFHRSTLYKGVHEHPFDIGLLCIEDPYEDFAIEERPLIATIAISAGKTLVEKSFGLAQKGSVRSYHLIALTDSPFGNWWKLALELNLPDTEHLGTQQKLLFRCCRF